MSTPKAGDDASLDYYEILQINPTAEPDTIHRVYRLLAQRIHPDNKETGDEERFRALHEAYKTLSDPEKRAQYDIMYDEWRKRRWRLLSKGDSADTDLEAEQITRLSVLEILYSQRRAEVNSPGIFILDLEDLTGRAREHLEFTLWYLAKKGFIDRGDSSRIAITVQGVDYLEQHYGEGLRRRRLKAPKEEA
jgi:curved DNA-binding protein CbpA